MSHFNVFAVAIIFIFIVNFGGIPSVYAQNNNCTKLFRGVRRVGQNMAGRLEIPVDSEFPKFQLRLKFNRAIHHLTVRQLRAKDVGTRREFLIDPAADFQQDGIMKINAYLRLTHLFAPTPRLIGASYNGKLICGENVFDDAILVDLKTTTVRSIPILFVTTKLPKEQDEEEEVFN